MSDRKPEEVERWLVRPIHLRRTEPLPHGNDLADFEVIASTDYDSLRARAEAAEATVEDYLNERQVLRGILAEAKTGICEDFGPSLREALVRVVADRDHLSAQLARLEDDVRLCAAFTQMYSNVKEETDAARRILGTP